MKALLLFAALALSGCSAETRSEIETEMRKPAKDMTYGGALLLVIIGAVLAKSSHSCNCKDK